MKKIFFISFFLSALFAFSDAGYLRSIMQNPAPITRLPNSEHPAVQMLKEDVLIELHGSSEGEPVYADVTARFVFQNKGESTSLEMFFPVEVLTLFYPLYNWTSNQYNMTVSVNSANTEISNMYIGVYDPEQLEQLDITWEEFSKVAGTMYSEEPVTGDFIFFENPKMPTDQYNYSFYEPLAQAYTWSVDFYGYEIKIVECSYRYAFTSDYDNTVFRFAYPLYTGATWKGSIERGRIIVAAADDFNWNDLKFHMGLYLPKPEYFDNYYFGMNPEFDGTIGQDELLTAYDGQYYSNALVWEFSNLKPVLNEMEWTSFYPDQSREKHEFNTSILLRGIIKYRNYMNSMPGLRGTVIFLYVSRDYVPEYYFVISENGIPVFSEDGLIEVLPADSSFKVIEDMYPLNRLDIRYSGYDEEAWIYRMLMEENGYVIPNIIPSPYQY